VLKCIQQFASKHKPQTFSRVCLRLKRDVYRWKRHVLKGETSKRNDRNETAETIETTETKRPKRNDRNETTETKQPKRNGRKYKLQEKWKILKYEIYGKFY
jgi:hypothetical protein